MAKTATLNIKTDPEIKEHAEALYESFGITLSDAVNMFLRMSLMEGGLPFELKIPDFFEDFEEALQERMGGLFDEDDD